MPRFGLLKITSVFVFVISHQILADDTPLALIGETLVPIRSTEIQLVNEDVNVHAHVKKVVGYEWPDDATVSATLRFRNPTDKDVSLLIGFPIDKMFGNPKDPEEGGNYQVEKLNFRADADGQTVKPRIFEDKNLERLWYVWEQTFPAKKLISIKHSYWLYWGGNHIAPESFNVRYFQYILTTGSLWHGNIERATITIHFDQALDQRYFYGFPKPTEQTARRVQWEFKDFEPESEVVFAYSWASDKMAALSFVKMINNRARTEATSIVHEIKRVGLQK
ncbi:MAG: hypothetical protein EXS64_02805 [Candidatus Latescibacteria bacterium]|nr:hypothetical protein [Candidatus Latescibacterota bacterium]